jgi:hypothetical protein
MLALCRDRTVWHRDPDPVQRGCGVKRQRPQRHCIIRNQQEVYVIEVDLTPEERRQVAERQSSAEARRWFGNELRRLRRIEDAPLKAALKANR